MLSDKEAEKKFKEMKLVIATPEKLMWGTNVSILWTMAIAVMLKPEVTHFKADAACPLSVCRNRLLRSFYDSDNDWILFLDDDTVPPYDAILQMIKYSDEYDILSGLYFRKSRRKAHKPVAFANVHYDEDGKPWWNSLVRWPKGACDVSAFGMGCCLIPRHAIEKIIEKQGHPLFHYDQDETDGWLIDGEKDYYSVGEDLYFCRKAVDSGLKLGLVTTVKCEHTGPHMAITEDDFIKAYKEGRLLGQAKELPLINIDQKLVLNELMTYYHEEPKGIMENISLGTFKMNDELKSIKLNTQEDRSKYYMDSRNYLYHTIGWNYFYHDTVDTRNQLSLISEGSVLHYGGGCGDIVLKCAQLGLKDITYLEWPGSAYDFSRWRINNRKHSDTIKTVELKEDKDVLEKGKKYDTIICLDFLEHCVNPIEHLKRIREHSHDKTKFLLGLNTELTTDKNGLFVKHSKNLREMFIEVGIPTDIIQPLESKKMPGIQDEKFRPVDKM